MWWAILFAELPQWLENFANDVSSLWPIVLLIGAGYGLIRWASNKFKNEVRDLIIVEIEPLKAEFQNNGGSSFKDALDRLEAAHQDLKNDIMKVQRNHDQINTNQREIWRTVDGLSAQHVELWTEIRKQRANSYRYAIGGGPDKNLPRIKRPDEIPSDIDEDDDQYY